MKVLFIIKKRLDYGVSYGLKNSCQFVSDYLNSVGVNSKTVEVIDNNSIDREVTLYRPTHVFIEALWVVPQKFPILFKLHPKVKWFVRLHSQTPFIAHEGSAFGWLNEYRKLGVNITVNSENFLNEIKELGFDATLSPNIYPLDDFPSVNLNEKTCEINIGCFGAIRPLKNTLQQATAAIIAADDMGKHLRFHINGSRVEQKAEPIVKNLENLFAGTSHELVRHPWMGHNEFTDLVKEMDLVMQVSFSETFNIVAADAVANLIPIIVSPEIKWASCLAKANPTKYESIVRSIKFNYKFGKLVALHNLWKLGNYNQRAKNSWNDLLNETNDS